MKRLIIPIGLICLLALSACAPSASAAAKITTISTTMTDFSFDPQTWTVPAGQEVELDLTNAGTAVHTWSIMQSPISGSYTSADEADIYFDSGAVPASSSKKVTFTAPRTPGNYQVVCIEPGHFEAGMLGILTVK